MEELTHRNKMCTVLVSPSSFLHFPNLYFYIVEIASALRFISQQQQHEHFTSFRSASQRITAFQS